jgi:hypothetical protein
MSASLIISIKLNYIIMYMTMFFMYTRAVIQIVCLFYLNTPTRHYSTHRVKDSNIPRPIPEILNPDLIRVNWLEDFIKREKLNILHSRILIYKSNPPIYKIIFETTYKHLCQPEDRDFISQTYRNLRKATTRERIAITLNCKKETIFINGRDYTSQFSGFFNPTFIYQVITYYPDYIQNRFLDDSSEFRHVLRELIRRQNTEINGWFDFAFWFELFLHYLYILQKKISDLFD